MTAKPMENLELYYAMIQFLIRIIPCYRKYRKSEYSKAVDYSTVKRSVYTKKLHVTREISLIIQNSNQMASSVDRNHMFYKRILSTLAIFKATSKLFGL